MSTSNTRRITAWFRPDVVVNIFGLLIALGVAAWLADRLTAGQEFKALATVVLVAVMVAIVARPRFGFLLWLAIAPFSSIFVWKMGSGLPDLGLHRLAALVTLFVLVAQAATGQRRFARLTGVDVAAALFIIGMALSVPASRLGIVGGAQYLFDFIVIPLLVYFFARELLRGPRGIQQAAVVLALVGALLGLFAVREQLTNQPFLSPIPFRWTYGPDIWKLTSFFGAPATLSLTLVMTVPLVLVAATRPGLAASRLLWGAALIMALAGIWQAYVRAGWLSAAAAIAIVILLSPTARRYSPRLILAALVLIAILGSRFIPQTLNGSGGFVNSNALRSRLWSEGPIDYRRDALRVGLEIAGKSPIWGLGLDNFGQGAANTSWAFSQSIEVRIGTWDVAPHNNYIYLLTSAGLVGLLSYLALLAAIGWRGFRGWRHAGRSPGGDQGPWAALLATLIAYAIFSYTFDVINAQLASMLLFLVVGAVLAPREAARGETRA